VTVLAAMLAVTSCLADRRGGFLGCTVAEYRAAQFKEAFMGSNPDIHEFIWNGLQVSVIFYKEQSVFAEMHKLAYTLPFSDAEIQMILVEIQRDHRGILRVALGLASMRLALRR
jgi:hypothetical protein